MIVEDGFVIAKMNQTSPIFVFREGEWSPTHHNITQSKDMKEMEHGVIGTHEIASSVREVEPVYDLDSSTAISSSVSDESSDVNIQPSTSAPIFIPSTHSIPSTHPPFSIPSSQSPHHSIHSNSSLFEIDPVPVVPQITRFFSKRRRVRPVSFSSAAIRNRCDPSHNASCPDITMVTQLTYLLTHSFI